MGSEFLTGADWRTTTALKPLDADGDAVYGTQGYAVFGPGTVGQTDGAGTGSVDFVAGGLTSQPSFGSFSVATGAGTQFAFSNFGYAAIDDPTVAPGVAVADIQSGLGGFAGVTPVASLLSSDIVQLTIGSGVPASFRFGVITNASVGTDLLLTLRQTVGGLSANAGAPASAFGVSYSFFDVVGAVTGDVYVLSLTKADDTSTVVALSGVTIDVVPEPSSLLLLAATSTVFLLRRRRNDHSPAQNNGGLN